MWWFVVEQSLRIFIKNYKSETLIPSLQLIPVRTWERHFFAFENRRHRYFSPPTVISRAPSWLSWLNAVPIRTLFSFSKFSLSIFSLASCRAISACTMIIRLISSQFSKRDIFAVYNYRVHIFLEFIQSIQLSGLEIHSWVPAVS